ncbi:hypothetical protein JOB18_044609 [Solea senegalensis]|uniref:NACHT domain-containing protein n=1 Tax=Solea senegalensis TaxID=28829 RepID=A0AAV6QC79_SOLSE|nr:hypothetical protein JOB18_044609 [Solea senegalensis]
MLMFASCPQSEDGSHTGVIWIQESECWTVVDTDFTTDQCRSIDILYYPKTMKLTFQFIQQEAGCTFDHSLTVNDLSRFVHKFTQLRRLERIVFDICLQFEMPPRLSPTNDAIHHVLSKMDKTSKLEVKYINAEKGRGVFARKTFCCGEFVVEYRGDMINDAEAQRRPKIFHPSCTEENDGVCDTTTTHLESLRYNSSTSDISVNEEPCSSQEAIDTIVVQASLKTNGNRVYDKKQYCLYCKKAYVKMARHLERAHHNKLDVAKALSLPKGSLERKKQLEYIRNRGNYAHNAAVIESGKGELVPFKRPSKDAQGKDFMHCAYCQALFTRKVLWRHKRSCKLQPAPVPVKPGKNRRLDRWRSAMNQIKASEEEAPPSKTTLCEEHEGQRRIHQQRPDSAGPGPGPGPSCVSMSSDWSMDEPLYLKQEQRRIHQQGPDSARPGPGPSCVSMKSDRSIGRLISFKDGQKHGELIVDQQRTEVLSGQSVQQHGADLDSIFKLLEENIICFVKNELKKIHKVLDTDHTEVSESQREDEEQRSSREAFLKITEDFLRRMKQEKLADSKRTFNVKGRTSYFLNDPLTDLFSCVLSEIRAPACRGELKSNLKKKFQCLFEGVAKAGNPTLLNEIFTELYITEGGTGEVNEEHEVRQIERASWKPDRPETTIRQEDIFKAPAGRGGPIRRVMTKGVAGIGKTVLTQKFTLDWAEDKSNQDVQLMFPFTFRELNVLKEKKFSLVELIHHFFTETKEAGICRFEDFKVVFIFDGLDECRLPLDFHNTEILTDVTASTSVDVLLTNLIRGKLLPSARLWITTRPAAANQMPPDCVDMVTEVRGFTDPQKEDYFRKRFRDEKQARRIISHIQTSQSLHIMCHIPVFCWITAKVLENMLKTRDGGELPKTLTEMYIHFLVVQSKVKKVKYDGGTETDPHWSPENRKMIKSLGKLAFEQLQKGNLIFYESDLTECGIDITAASVYSGVFTQIFKEERGLYQDKVFCFVRLSVQEFLAALHVHLTFITSGTNLLSEEPTTSQWSRLFRKKPKLNHLHQSAVDEALLSPNGHLDLSLRFLLGLSLETNQKLLRGLLTQTGSGSQTNQKTVEYIKKKISENLSAERSINLFHCLNELNHPSLVEEIQESLTSGRLSTKTLSPAQWSALVFILLSSGKDLEEFDLKKYSASEEALLKLLLVVKASNKALSWSRSSSSITHSLSRYSRYLALLDMDQRTLSCPSYSGSLISRMADPHTGISRGLTYMLHVESCLTALQNQALLYTFNPSTAAAKGAADGKDFLFTRGFCSSEHDTRVMDFLSDLIKRRHVGRGPPVLRLSYRSVQLHRNTFTT